LSISLVNINRFSKCFNRRTQQQIAIDVITDDLSLFTFATLPCETLTSENEKQPERDFSSDGNF